jgi:gliding motility-associated protein GldM
MGMYKAGSSKEGLYKWSGTVSFKDPTSGEIKSFTTDPIEYQVAKPSAVVSPDKMNVFYMGVDNPVSVSAPGIAKEKLKVSVSGGSISGSNGNYNVRVSGGSEATVTVSAEIEKGKTQVLGATKFRIKTVPDPLAQFAGVTSGPVSRSEANNVSILSAELDNFDFALKFRVTKFNVFISKPGQDPIFYSSPDGSFTSQIRAAVSKLSPGDAVSFSSITVYGEDGKTRNLKTGVNVVIRN